LGRGSGVAGSSGRVPGGWEYECGYIKADPKHHYCISEFGAGDEMR
jgi:hypothetical protein